MTVRSIVLGVDDNEYSWHAVDLARAVAGSIGADLIGFHAGGTEVPAELVERAGGNDIELHAAAAMAGDDGVARTLIAHAAGLGDAVVALTSHARRGITAAVLGSTARAVLEHTPEPVLMFGPHHGEPYDLTRVLACVDGSPLSEAVLPVATDWAGAAGVPLWLVHVIDPKVSIAAGGADSNYVQRLAHDLADTGLDIEFDVLHGDDAGESISNYANGEAGTLSVLATHGHTGLRAIAMGSVATHVTRHAEGPTLVLRPADGATS